VKNIIINRYSNWLMGLAAIFLVIGCDNSTGSGERNWTLVWADEFEGAAGALPDTSNNWVFDIGTNWGNDQLEYDTDRPENCSLDGEGNLAITARAESFAGQPFTSARIKTQYKFAKAYGRFEARIKMPYGPGIWPAFWLLGADIDSNPWPQCGEIDIMEYRGQETSTVHGSVHGPGYSGGAAITKRYDLPQARFDTDFHVFRIDWGEKSIIYYVDDFPYLEITPDDVTGEWVFDKPFFIILNVAVGGNYVGFPTSDTQFPQSMLVDYVRVYE
jgi:beta-glucanase (GH16 family)